MNLPRPDWCPDPDCTYLDSYGDRACVGRLPEPVYHEDGDDEPDLRNTHHLCLENEGEIITLRVNDQDMYLLGKLAKVIREDVMMHGLPADGRENYDFSP